MKKIFSVILLLLPMALLAQDVTTIKSPKHRVAMLELYTSEGCSSCPPADIFLTELKAKGISEQQLIPMAFHVTYWDYIGWKDRFAQQRFDQRQRERASQNKQHTVYTPQFIFSGEDYRRSASFSNDVDELVRQKASVDLELTADRQSDKLWLKLKADISGSKHKNIGFYFVLLEDNLFSEVKDGENQGERLQHDYVVRQFMGPYFQLQSEQTIVMLPEWKQQDLSIVAFAEDPKTGEVLQAVRVKY